MALKKIVKPAADPSEIQLLRSHPSNPILVTPEDILDNPTRIQIRAPRVLVIRGGCSNRFDLGAVIMLPENVTAHVEPIQPDAYERGYNVTSGTLNSGEDVCLFFRNYGQRTVEFHAGDVVGTLVFQRHRVFVVEVDCELPPVPEKVAISRPGRVPEGELPFET